MKNLRTSTHILLLMAEAGFGHRAACQAVAAALKEVACDACQITTLNLSQHPMAPALMRLPERSYDRTVNSSLHLFDLTYRVTDTHLGCSLVGRVMARGLSRATRQILEEMQPDAILSTIHLYQAPVLAARKQGYSHIPFFSVVTDLAEVHQIWFRAAPDVLFVPNETVRQQALQAGLRREQVVVSGIPVQPRIAAEQRSKSELRAGLGWRDDLPVALVVGSRRTPTLDESLAAVNQAHPPVQLVVTAGGDERLFRRLQAIDWQIPVYLYHYVNNMPELMRAADVLISKAGGLITAESLACGLPLIYTGHIPGQESGNLTYVVGQGAGTSAETPAQLAQTLQSWLANGSALLQQFAARAQQLGYPRAAQTIAERVWQAAAAHANERMAVTRSDPRATLSRSI